MIRLHSRSLSDAWQIQRRRIIRETELFLEHALVRPEMKIEIPTVQVGRGSFLPWIRDSFWREVLDL